MGFFYWSWQKLVISELRLKLILKFHNTIQPREDSLKRPWLLDTEISARAKWR